MTQVLGATTTNYGYGSGSDLLATTSVGGVATQAIGYTADGRIASLNPGIQAPGGQFITSLSYNQDAQLSAVNAGSGALASYAYDGFGQRIVKTFPGGSAGNIYQYGQDGMLLEETNSTGTAQADYIYLDGGPVAVLNGSALYYLHTDHLGTPQLATDSNQAVQWQASYDPFGQASVSGTITQNLRFPGQYFDVESGWNHNGFRDYLPAVGRYAEPDPLGRLGSGNNLYAYVGDNPTNLTDPLGLCPAMNHAPSNATPANPCAYMGSALPPSAYASAGKAASNNPVTSTLDLTKGFRIGGYLDAQPLASGNVYERAAYGNYAYGVYMASAGFPLSVTLAGADGIAAIHKLSNPNQYSGRQMDSFWGSIPAANVANISAGYNAQRSGTTCHN